MLLYDKFDNDDDNAHGNRKSKALMVINVRYFMPKVGKVRYLTLP